MCQSLVISRTDLNLRCASQRLRFLRIGPRVDRFAAEIDAAFDAARRCRESGRKIAPWSPRGRRRRPAGASPCRPAATSSACSMRPLPPVSTTAASVCGAHRRRRLAEREREQDEAKRIEQQDRAKRCAGNHRALPQCRENRRARNPASRAQSAPAEAAARISRSSPRERRAARRSAREAPLLRSALAALTPRRCRRRGFRPVHRARSCAGTGA